MMNYPTRVGYFLCLLPKLAMVTVIALKGYGVISWTWSTVGGVVLLLVLFWLALDRHFADSGARGA
jgi:hypothetical protein